VVKRVAIVVLLAVLGAGCHWLRTGHGYGPHLAVHVGPPGVRGVRPVDVTATDLPSGTPATTTVWQDHPGGHVLATGTTLPLHFDLDVSSVGPGLHSLYVQSRVSSHERRNGFAFLDDRMRVNQLQALGTHNSYHEYPVPPLDGVEALQYFEDPLDVQLESQGVRQFELDVNTANDGSGRIDVFHVPTIDEGTTCRALVDCLTTIKTWSLAHPKHAVIGIQLELEANEFNLPVPYGAWGAADYDRLDAQIRSVFSEKELLTPDDLRGSHATLPEAIAQDGWPAIDSTRGQVMFVMDNGGQYRSDYLAGHPALAGRVIFTNADPGAPDAAFIKRNDPKGSFADIQSLIGQGYVVRTRADADTVEARVNDTTARDAAFASGSTWVSSDFVVPGRAFGTPYFVQIPGGTPSRCNPINTPTWCTSGMIESLP
jgi:Phosphoinositide phospholipase C, Ca2+-dependent